MSEKVVNYNFPTRQKSTTVKTKTSKVSVLSTENANIVNGNQYNLRHSSYLKYRNTGLILTDVVYEKYFTEKQIFLHNGSLQNKSILFHTGNIFMHLTSQHTWQVYANLCRTAAFRIPASYNVWSLSLNSLLGKVVSRLNV
jgi:hypothetical protein